MNEIESKQIYQDIKSGKKIYNEEYHCPLVIQEIANHGRVSAFLKCALVSEKLFWNWCARYPVFHECYRLAKAIALENWELEYIERKGDEDFEVKEWKTRGSRYFKTDPTKIVLSIDENSEPYDHYQQIMSQACGGDFSAAEIKQLMESVNVGTRVFEAFKLQQEVDKMKSDLSEMSQRHGNNIIPINQIAKVD